MTKNIEESLNLLNFIEIKKVIRDSFYYFIVNQKNELSALIFIYENLQLKNPLIKVVTNNVKEAEEINNIFKDKLVNYSFFNNEFTIKSDIILAEEIVFKYNINFVTKKEISIKDEKFTEWYIRNHSEEFDKDYVKKHGSIFLYENFLLDDMNELKEIFSSYNLEKIKESIKNNPDNYLNYVVKKLELEDKFLFHYIKLLIKGYSQKDEFVNNLSESFWYIMNEVNSDYKEILFNYICDIEDKLLNDIKFNICLLQEIKTDLFENLFENNKTNNYIKWFKSLSKKEIINSIKNYELLNYNYVILSDYLENEEIDLQLYNDLLKNNKQISLYLNKIKNQQQVYDWYKNKLQDNRLENNNRLEYILNATDIINDEEEFSYDEIIDVLRGYNGRSILNKEDFIYFQKIDNLNIKIEDKINILKNTIKEDLKKEKAIRYICEKNNFKEILNNF